MIGDNKFVFNQDTMIEAMQFWLDAVLQQKVRVVKVEGKLTSYTSAFEVSVSGIEEPK